MSSERSTLSEQAMQTNEATARSYYNVALPALQARFGTINSALAQGEPGYLSSAFARSRGAMADSLANRNRQQAAAFTRQNEAATRGGNPFASLNPSQIGAQLANALYGSRFQEGQANIDQGFNLMSMALGGAGQTGSSALSAAGNQLGAIAYAPNYNPTLAMISGIGSLAGSAYGAISQPDVNRSFPGSIYNPVSPSSWSGSAWNQWAGVPGASSVNLTSFSAE